MIRVSLYECLRGISLYCSGPSFGPIPPRQAFHPMPSLWRSSPRGAMRPKSAKGGHQTWKFTP